MSELYHVEVVEKKEREILLKLEQVHPDARDVEGEGEESPVFALMLLWEATEALSLKDHFAEKGSPLALAFTLDDLQDEKWIAQVARGIVRRAWIEKVEKGFDREAYYERLEEGGEEEEGPLAIFYLRVQLSHEDWLKGFEVGQKWWSAAYDPVLEEVEDCPPLAPCIVEEIVEGEEGEKAFFECPVVPGAPFYSYFCAELRIVPKKVRFPYLGWRDYATIGEVISLQDREKLKEQLLGKPVMAWKEAELPSQASFVTVGVLAAVYPHLCYVVSRHSSSTQVSTFFVTEKAFFAPIRYLRRYLAGTKPREIASEVKELRKVHRPLLKGHPFVTSLYSAALEGNKEAVRRYIEQGEDLNQKRQTGYTPLHAAVLHPEILEFLLKKGARVNVRDFEGYTPLMLAAYFGKLDSLRHLLNAGASLNRVSRHEDEGVFEFRDVVGGQWLATDFAILQRNWDCLEELVKRGALLLGDWWREDVFRLQLSQKEWETLDKLYHRYTLLPWKKCPEKHLYTEVLKLAVSEVKKNKDELGFGCDLFSPKLKAGSFPVSMIWPSLKSLPLSWKVWAVKHFLWEGDVSLLGEVWSHFLSPEEVRQGELLKQAIEEGDFSKVRWMVEHFPFLLEGEEGEKALRWAERAEKREITSYLRERRRRD